MHGVDFKIYVEKKVGENSTYVPVGGQRGGKLNRSADTVDTTTKDGNGWKEKRPGLLDWSIDGDGICILDDEGYSLLETAFLGRQLVLVRFGNGSLQFEGDAIITDFPLDVPFDNEVTYSIKLDGTGPLTKGAVESQNSKLKGDK